MADHTVKLQCSNCDEWVEIRLHGGIALVPAGGCPYCGGPGAGLSTAYVQVKETTPEEFEDHDDLLELEDTDE